MILETIIGLEIHVELNTRTKIFCGCSTEFGAEPNANTCPVCIGLPGTLPVLNEEAVNLAVRAGKALNCRINTINKFDRKNYFYPDLPKAYQISQFDLPICEHGYVDIDIEGMNKRINILRIHMEEDPGKLIHAEGEPITMIDYNRSGVPLIEIVTEPDIRSPKEAVTFLTALKAILEYSEVSDCKMEQGSLRCDANISLRPIGQEKLNTKVEIKNINSFKEILKALEKEEKRQKELYDFNEAYKIKQETRKWDSGKGRTIPMRSKEDAHDYRYFPEPDLPPVIIKNETLAAIQNTVPEMPEEKKARFKNQYGLNDNETEVLISKKVLAEYFEDVVSYKVSSKEASKWIKVEVMRMLKESENIEIPAKYLAKLIKLIENGRISRSAAKEVFDVLWLTEKTPEAVIKEKQLEQISGSDQLDQVISEAIEKNPDAVAAYLRGKEQSKIFLMGQVMKATKGQANPKLAMQILTEKLGKTEDLKNFSESIDNADK